MSKNQKKIGDLQTITYTVDGENSVLRCVSVWLILGFMFRRMGIVYGMWDLDEC